MNNLTHFRELVEMGKRVSGVDLHGADLSDIRLHRLTAEGVDFRFAYFHGADLTQAKILSSHFESAQLGNVDLTRAVLRLCTLDGAKAEGAHFDDARVEDCTAEAADLSRASFRGAHLTETSFSRAVLRGAKFDRAEGEGVEFRGADLRGATLVGAHFDEGDFRGADLRGADLSDGRFRSADFRGAVLQGTTMNNTDFTSAWFDDGEDPNNTASHGAPMPVRGVLDEMTVSNLSKLLTSLGSAFASQGNSSMELPQRMQQLAEKLDAAEPPEEWKAWLEPLMKITQGKPAIDEIIAELGKMKPDDLRGWLETIESSKRKEGKQS